MVAVIRLIKRRSVDYIERELCTHSRTYMSVCVYAYVPLGPIYRNWVTFDRN